MGRIFYCWLVSFFWNERIGVAIKYPQLGHLPLLAKIVFLGVNFSHLGHFILVLTIGINF